MQHAYLEKKPVHWQLHASAYAEHNLENFEVYWQTFPAYLENFARIWQNFRGVPQKVSGYTSKIFPDFLHNPRITPIDG